LEGRCWRHRGPVGADVPDADDLPLVHDELLMATRSRQGRDENTGPVTPSGSGLSGAVEPSSPGRRGGGGCRRRTFDRPYARRGGGGHRGRRTSFGRRGRAW
jgi:hypothetical protein